MSGHMPPFWPTILTMCTVLDFYTRKWSLLFQHKISFLDILPDYILALGQQQVFTMLSQRVLYGIEKQELLSLANRNCSPSANGASPVYGSTAAYLTTLREHPRLVEDLCLLDLTFHPQHYSRVDFWEFPIRRDIVHAQLRLLNSCSMSIYIISLMKKEMI